MLFENISANVIAALRWQGIKKQKIIMSTQVDLFTNVEGLQVSPAIAKLPVMPSAFTPDAKKHTSCHHELKAGEMWVGNTDVREGLSIPDYLIGKMQTARLGEQAYYIDGKPIHREYCRPLIIHKSEEMLYDKIMMERMSDAAK